MKFYKVKPQYDNYVLYKDTGVCLVPIDWHLVRNELYTARELRSLDIQNCTAILGYEKHKVTPDMFEEVQVNVRKTYHFFGSRFETKEDI